jgi:integrase
VYSKRDGKKIRKTFTTLAAAKAWRDDASGQVRRQQMRAPVPTTLAEAAEQWLDGARKGVIRTRSGTEYKPSAIRGYEAALRLRVLPEFGRVKLATLTRTDLQDLVDALVASGLNASTIGVTLLPLRAIYKRAVTRGEITVNPTADLQMPAVRGGRDRIAAPDECERLLAAMAPEDRPLWATAMYAGLRRGELMALRIEDVDLATGVINVRRGWDHFAGEILPKSGKGRRVPIAAVLRDHLLEHRAGQAWQDGLMFGLSASQPFLPTSVRARALVAWGWKRTSADGERAWEKASDAALDPISIHECRHTFASLMIAAGVNAKALSTYMGHANISITLDRYGHLMPGNEDQAAALLDAFLARATEEAARASLAPVVS